MTFAASRRRCLAAALGGLLSLSAVAAQTTACDTAGLAYVGNDGGRVQAVCTSKAPTGPYRGVGRPVSTFVMERLIDMAARRLGFDPAEMRRRNLVAPDELPGSFRQMPEQREGFRAQQTFYAVHQQSHPPHVDDEAAEAEIP